MCVCEDVVSEDSRKQAVNGLFSDTSNGCSTDVHPPGIIYIAVLASAKAAFTPSVRWAQKQ